MFRATENQRSSETREVVPWEVETRPPEGVSKRGFQKWCSDPETKHCFFTAFEGVDPHHRISKENPVWFQHALVVDYDSPLSDGELDHVLESLKKWDYPPNLISRTFSNNLRFVWRFEDRISVDGNSFCTAFQDVLAKRLRLDAVCRGLDLCYKKPQQLYEAGHSWETSHKEPIPLNILHLWASDALQKSTHTEFGPEIPLDIISVEVERLYPGRWKGSFDEGNSGVRFWDPAADNPRGCQVTKSGMRVYSSGEGFMPWTKILGGKFIEQFEADRFGAPAKRYYYDGKFYWDLRPEWGWVPNSLVDVVRTLKVEYGLNSSKGKSVAYSEVDKSLHQIGKLSRVDGVFGCPFSKETIVIHGGCRYLNICRTRPITPHDQPCAWGEGFPQIALFLDTWFDPLEQLSYYLSWLSRFFRGLVLGESKDGQVIYIGGPTGIGKTYFTEKVVGVLVGNVQEATDYIKGKDMFNSTLIESPLWTIHDTEAVTNNKDRASYTAVVKKVAANQSFKYRAMHQVGFNRIWMGRLIITHNDDPVSVQIVPNAELSIVDKLMMFKVKESGVDYEEFEKVFKSELKYFGRFLMDYEMPEHCKNLKDPKRWGVASYKHPDIFEVSKQLTPVNSFIEFLDMWRREHFKVNKNDEEWCGSAADFLFALHDHPDLRDMARDSGWKAPNAVGRNLSAAISTGCEWINPVPSKTSTIYVIKRPQE